MNPTTPTRARACRPDPTFRAWALAALVAVLLPSLPGCGEAGVEEDGESPDVVASIFPVADLARRVAGPDVQVRVLLPRGASPGTFEPTPEAVRAIRSARVLLLVGGGLEPWAAELVSEGSGTRTITLLEGLDLRGEGVGPGTGNPHLWLDPVRTRDQLLPRITEAVALAAPSARRRLEERARALADTLKALDADIRSALEGLDSRSFVASHPAWVYFAERYDLRQVGVLHAHPGQEPSPRRLAQLLEDARSAEVPAVFGEPQLPDAAARTLAGELGVPLLPLDPLGGGRLERRGSYTALMRYNTAQFVRGLSSSRSGPGEGDASGS